MSMSLESQAETVAAQIRRQEFVEVLAHHDADGISAASILCHAMLRAGIRFRLRVRQDVSASDLSGENAYLLCDTGAGVADLPKTTMVVDHHLPLFEGEFHANPRLAGIDGDRELSAAGTAYFVARKLGDNRDLAGLVIPGIIGDRQEIVGKNLEIFNEAVANGIIVPDRGLTLPGRDMVERWYTATNPYLAEISGNEQLVADFVEQAKDPFSSNKPLMLDVLISRAVLEAAPKASLAGLQGIYGDTYHLQREVIEDAHALAAIIDACGKTGNGDIGATLCLRSSHDIDRAWEITRQHRIRVIEAVRTARPYEGIAGVFEVEDGSVPSDVADILSRDLVPAGPVLVYAKSGSLCRISVRSPAGSTVELGPKVRELASVCGGSGGGHNLRAGATIPCDKIGLFAKGWQEAVAL
jgi:single-stranded-DNA-specific exonuclease